VSTLEERALADADDSDRFAGTQRDTLTSFIQTSGALVKMTAERDAALAEVELLRIAPRGKAKCSCDFSPSGDGPEQDCPEHGDVRWYAAWLEQASDAYNEAAAAIHRVEALLGDHDGPLWAVRGVREADIRAALEPTP